MSKATDNKIKPSQLWKARTTGAVVNVIMRTYPYVCGWADMVPQVVFSDVLSGDLHHAPEDAFRYEFERIPDAHLPPPDFGGGAPAQTGIGPTPEEMAAAIPVRMEFPGATFDLNPMQAVQ